LCHRRSSLDAHNAVWGSPGNGVTEKRVTATKKAVETTGGDRPTPPQGGEPERRRTDVQGQRQRQNQRQQTARVPPRPRKPVTVCGHGHRVGHGFGRLGEPRRGAGNQAHGRCYRVRCTETPASVTFGFASAPARLPPATHHDLVLERPTPLQGGEPERRRDKRRTRRKAGGPGIPVRRNGLVRVR
jgi:hypothetical protein